MFRNGIAFLFHGPNAPLYREHGASPMRVGTSAMLGKVDSTEIAKDDDPSDDNDCKENEAHGAHTRNPPIGLKLVSVRLADFLLRQLINFDQLTDCR